MIELRCEYLSLECICLYDFVMSRTNFSLRQLSLVVWMLKISLVEAGEKSEVLVTAISLQPTTF